MFSIITNTEDYITEDAILKSSTSAVNKGTVLCVIRSGILVHTFPVALAGVRLAINQDLNAIIPDQKKISENFLYYTLKSMEKIILTQGVKKGPTVHSIRSGFLRELTIPLPKMQEQEAIVAELNQDRETVELAKRMKNRSESQIKAVIDGVWGKEGEVT